ncbi:hypothetical protein SEMRO_2555_G331100.1 [Seminavis robusta]|uniref:Uncharacterized protein n=1 Tax=Seminavis robusta TaxID=568900 RepID=A0A9N8F351_9STRA|nr:hypothetical protein SEMRO_2555_G331100.1 [Seminavis robusta]|eukprot:Sro2555_g331100.1 n/a (191) ;mRNA; f:629-1201
MKLQEDSIAPELKQAILRMQQASEKLPGTPVLEPSMWINTSHPKASNNLPFLQEMLDRVKQVRIQLTDSFWNTQQGQSILVQVHAGKRHYGWTSDMPLPPHGLQQDISQSEVRANEDIDSFDVSSFDYGDYGDGDGGDTSIEGDVPAAADLARQERQERIKATLKHPGALFASASPLFGEILKRTRTSQR